MKIRSQLLIALIGLSCFSSAQNLIKDYKLPGKGIKQYDFLYAGEWDIRKPTAQSMFLVRDGKVVWQYSIPMYTATGNIPFKALSTAIGRVI